jgi:lipoprotein-anchoring transpeptidase ErfK/SrfK
MRFSLAVLTICLLSCRPAEPDLTPVSSDATEAGPTFLHHIPADYVIVARGGATAFAHPPRDGVSATGSSLAAGFGFVVTQRRNSGGRQFVRLGDTGWVAAEQVAAVRPSTFSGVAIPRGAPLNVAWVVAQEAIVRVTPADTARSIVARPVHTRITPAGPCRDGWCPLAVGWMRAADLAIASLSDRPAGVAPTARWLDIDLSSQVLVAYDADRPAFVTLVSTGIGQSDSPLGTPTGTFTISSKRELVSMDNLEHTDVVPYAYDVPLAQYFNRGKALHAALWHDRFGAPTSHGCVNLSPADAEWLYGFTEAQAGARRPGTTVRVRGQRPSVRGR